MGNVQSFHKGSKVENIHISVKEEEVKVENMSIIKTISNKFLMKNKEKITQADLKKVFASLRSRCPRSWNPVYERRAIELHQKFMSLKNFKAVEWVDPAPMFVEEAVSGSGLPGLVETTDVDMPLPRNLMTKPRLWNMYEKESGKEFSEILRHFTRFAPIRGRAFIHAWLMALLPCFCRWMLLSSKMYTDEETKVVPTLKHFFGAFGQPGIVCCLPEKGAEVLKLIQNAARAVEATGRGDVEQYYWKRLTESSFQGKNSWEDLSKIEDVALKLSQLDCFSVGWLEDAPDWPYVFSEIVSPKVTPIFEKLVKDIVKEKTNAKVCAGPAKTRSRILAKSFEYMTDFQSASNAKDKGERWENFSTKFMEAFHRAPNQTRDFIFNILDFARCSINVPTARDVLEVKKLVEDRLNVVSVKNGYNSCVKVKGSGYRDMKLLVEVEFNGIGNKHFSEMEDKTVLICEIQIVCKAWLANKKITSLSYKVLRAITLKDLFNDFRKYINPNQRKIGLSALEVVKSGWMNMSKTIDISAINAQWALLKAAEHGWDKHSVFILVNQLGANPELRGGPSSGNYSPLFNAASMGRSGIIQSLLAVGADVNGQDRSGWTALHVAISNNYESCVRALMAAADIDTSIRTSKGETVLDLAAAPWVSPTITKILKGEYVTVQTSSLAMDNESADVNRVTKEAASGTLTNFLDSNSVSADVMSKVLYSGVIGRSLENVLQAIWFGADRHSMANAMNWAICQGSAEVVAALIENGRASYEGVLNLAAQNSNADVVLKLIELGADINEEDRRGENALHYAQRNRLHGPAITEVLLSKGIKTSKRYKSVIQK